MTDNNEQNETNEERITVICMAIYACGFLTGIGVALGLKFIMGGL